MIIPTILEESPKGVVSFDLYSRLLKDRVVILGGEINDAAANLIVAQLLYLDSVSKKPVSLYVNSPGGSVTSTMAILDTMNHIKSDVHTVCIGIAASGAAVLLSAGKKGKRSALKNSEIMIHQPHGGIQGQATDINILADNIKKTKTKINRILAFNTGQPIERITEDSDRDFYLDPSAAKKYGIVDTVCN